MYYELWIWGTNTVVASGFLGDGFGSLAQSCTPTLNVENGTYAMFLYTMGSVGGNLFLVRDELVSNDIWAAWYQVSWPPPSGSVNAPVARTDTAMNVYQAIAFSLSQNPGLTPFSSWKVFRVNDTAGPGGTPLTAQGGEGFVWIGRPNSERKFIIAHELGHAVEQNSAGIGAAVDLSDIGNPPAACQSTTADHTLTSREWITTAKIEGFANFYAAASFNLPNSGADCWMRVGPTRVDCAGTMTHAARWMETQCVNGTFGARGVELDWLRAFWDVRVFGATRPSMNTMLRWIRDADDVNRWMSTNAYGLLDAEANDTATHGTAINTNWDAAKVANGIVH
jgi:hypothetical protein